MQTFLPGQRWISDAELDLGLGTVLRTDVRTVTMVFLGSGETRVYAKATAPLTRVRFGSGDSVESHEGWILIVERLTEAEGLFVYHGLRDDGSAADLAEGALSNFIKLNKPRERLLAGQVDPASWFTLRHQALSHFHQLLSSPVRGLLGPRVTLMPHQLYIAKEVGSRYAPRVLLADEVGLGKTIEAGLIIHQQLLTDRAQRVLVVVPEALQHQWLVEMRRRFNLPFSLLDEEYLESQELGGSKDNPFYAEQLVLTSLELLVSDPTAAKHALDGRWDLLVVDEAHRLEWSEKNVSDEYLLVEGLAGKTRGMLLLTATPEQFGRAAHFARLRLLDPSRFHDYAAFLDEEAHYEPVARGVQELLDADVLAPQAGELLVAALGADAAGYAVSVMCDPKANAAAKAASRGRLIEMLLDRHGTGRVFFRNTRATVPGFSVRHLNAYPLPLPASYGGALARIPDERAMQDFVAREYGWAYPSVMLFPELVYEAALEDESGQAWWSVDPRLPWLGAKLKELAPEKVLVICANSSTALSLELGLRTLYGTRAAVFHEGLSIVERDRAAAYFAASENAAQVLISSEIGSEGRNFQFLHHLVLFDLPLNPDLLEQRIGRVDRIGQKQVVEIHVPYLQGTAQEVAFRWYQEGMNAFEKTSPAGQAVFREMQRTLGQVLVAGEGLDALVAATRERYGALIRELQEGRDRLLELHSCKTEPAAALAAEIAESDDDPTIRSFMERVFGVFGIDIEDHSENAVVLVAGPHMLTASFPGITEDGVTVTFDRATALAHEDMQFLTWEHPMVRGVFDLLLGGEAGNASVVRVRDGGFPAGMILLEAVFVIEAGGPRHLQIDRFLPSTPVRIVLDQALRERTELWSADWLSARAQPVEPVVASQWLRGEQKLVRRMLDSCDVLAKKQLPEVLRLSSQAVAEELGGEVKRLTALKAVNPNVREDEVSFLKQQGRGLLKHIQQATVRLDSVRLVVAE